MAKKDNRIIIAFVCKVCNKQNYISTKNKMEHKEKMALKKFCKKCHKVTDHKETDKLD